MSASRRSRRIIAPRWFYAALACGCISQGLAVADQLLINGTPSVAVQSSEQERQGLAVAKEVYSRQRGFGDMTVDLKMILRDNDGGSAIRKLRSRTLEMPADGDRSLLIFDEPVDVAGTILLSYAHRGAQDDDRWLYLPALKRTKRIASKNRAGSFMGSEFAYEDLDAFELEDYRFNLQGTESLEGKQVFVLECVPTNADSGYSRLVQYVDTQEYRILKVDFFDRRGDSLKSVVFEGYAKFGNIWKPSRLRVSNVQNGKSTELEFDGYRFKTGLLLRDFDQFGLESMQ